MALDKNDIVDYYFIMITDVNGTRVNAWTDEKILADAYMEFHKCKNFKMKKVTDTLYNINRLTEECIHDEIQIMNALIPDSKSNKLKSIAIPCTKSEISVVNDDSSTFLATRINYEELNKMSRWLKGKYQQALKGVLFRDVCDTVLAIKKPSPIIYNIGMNSLKVLLYVFPDRFG